MVLNSLKKITAYFALLLLIVSFSSCLDYKEVEVIKVTEVSIKEISVKGVDVEVAMQVNNPNNYNISIVDSDLSLFLKGDKVGSASIKDKVTLKKKSIAIYRFTLQSNFNDIGVGGLSMLMGLMTQSAMEVQVLGDIKAQAKGISKRIPVDFTEQVKL